MKVENPAYSQAEGVPETKATGGPGLEPWYGWRMAQYGLCVVEQGDWSMLDPSQKDKLYREV